MPWPANHEPTVALPLCRPHVPGRHVEREPPRHDSRHKGAGTHRGAHLDPQTHILLGLDPQTTSCLVLTHRPHLAHRPTSGLVPIMPRAARSPALTLTVSCTTGTWTPTPCPRTPTPLRSHALCCGRQRCVGAHLWSTCRVR